MSIFSKHSTCYCHVNTFNEFWLSFTVYVNTHKTVCLFSSVVKVQGGSSVKPCVRVCVCVCVCVHAWCTFCVSHFLSRPCFSCFFCLPYAPFYLFTSHSSFCLIVSVVSPPIAVHSHTHTHHTHTHTHRAKSIIKRQRREERGGTWARLSDVNTKALKTLRMCVWGGCVVWGTHAESLCKFRKSNQKSPEINEQSDQAGQTHTKALPSIPSALISPLSLHFLLRPLSLSVCWWIHVITGSCAVLSITTRCHLISTVHKLHHWICSQWRLGHSQ